MALKFGCVGPSVEVGMRAVRQAASSEVALLDRSVAGFPAVGGVAAKFLKAQSYILLMHG